MHATATATVAAPASRVWAVLSDHEGMSSWAPGLKITLIRPGAPEPNGVGAQRRIKAIPGVPPIVEEVIAFEPDQRMSYRGVSGMPFRNYVGDVVLRPSGSGTAITYTVSADNPVPGVAAVLANGLLFALKRAVKKAG
ncbi:SRPBCC family protein [Mycolicibacter sp. MYC123]|uniref:SRPBCC family protein n=1 Tax=[Mycobacterium] zoologicum TaxID=2872311 RepID=A0ABU5YHA5_9MYCO|nr:SRPBCC family protein [Mycolicibacter sp. MYC123]MEB3049444.1 SRPBCC family protein [Mycolicibacter sp. MYC123]